jgi:uncharacterized membrane protein YgcG
MSGEESTSALVSEVKPKATATTPSGLRLGGKVLAPPQASLVDAIFRRAEAAGRELTLEELFLLTEPEDILNEAKGRNKQLLNFLNKEEALEEVLDYAGNFGQPYNPNALRTGAKTEEEKEFAELRIKCIHISCELLALEGTEACIYTDENSQKILLFLFGFVLQNSGYEEARGVMPPQISAIAQVFVVQNPEKVVNFLIGLDSRQFVSSFVDNLDQSEVSNLLLGVVWLSSPMPSKMKSDAPNEAKIKAAESFNSWLSSGDLVPRLIGRLCDTKSDEASIHAAEILQEMIAVSARHIPRKLPPPLIFQQFIVEDSLSRVVPAVLGLQTEQVFSAAVTVILELLKYEGLYLKSNPSASPSCVLRLIEQNIEKLIIKLKLKNPKEKFGFLRLRVLGFFGRLIAHALAYPGGRSVIDTLTRLDFWNIILELFFTFTWNNFAHNVIERVMGVILGAGPEYKELKKQILVDYKLLDRIMEADKLNQEDSKDPGGRRGYMGALTNLSITVTKCGAQDPELNKLLTDYPGWSEYVGTSLKQAREVLETANSTFPQPKPEGEGRAGRGPSSYARGGRGGGGGGPSVVGGGSGPSGGGGGPPPSLGRGRGVPPVGSDAGGSPPVGRGRGMGGAAPPPGAAPGGVARGRGFPPPPGRGRG